MRPWRYPRSHAPPYLSFEYRIGDREPPCLQLPRPRAQVVLRNPLDIHRWKDRRDVLLEVHLLHDALNRDVAPVVSREGEQHRGQSALDVGELRRQPTDGDDLDLLWIQFLRQPRCREGPAADHCPSLDLRVCLLRAGDLLSRIGRGFRVVEGADDRDPGSQCRFPPHAVHALAKVRRVLVPREDRHRALLLELCGKLAHHRLSEGLIIQAVEREAFRPGRVAVEGHHRHAAVDGLVDRRRTSLGV